MDVNDSQWKTSNHKLASETIQNSTIEQEVLDITAIDEEADIIAVSPSQLRQGHKT
ncbi:Uncharacterised protein [Streptococcus pneumoniae]|nr:Uncharacterised protein [Streptococcus pneumoniae]CJW46384.1 Uncharacterised protein [Streptococcus pneumoniae]